MKMKKTGGSRAALPRSDGIDSRVPHHTVALEETDERDPRFLVFSLIQFNRSGVLGSHHVKFREIYSCLIVDDHIKMRVDSREDV